MMRNGGPVRDGGGRLQADDAAASAERYAADKNAETQRYFYDETRRDLTPYMDTGRQANSSMADLMGLNGEDGRNRGIANFRTDPGYQFAFARRFLRPADSGPGQAARGGPAGLF